MLGAEQQFRTQYDPQRIEAQQALQQKYGPEQYKEQLSALQQLDPQGTAIRQQVGESVSQNLGTQYDLPPALQQAVASQYLGRQVAGGNVLGNAAATGADIYAGNAANQYYQQNLANAQRFLQGPTPEQQLLAVQPVSPDRASAYVNPAAPAQAAQNSYQNYLSQYQAAGGSQGSVSPFLQIAQGLGQAAATYYGGPVAGAAAGAASQYTNQYFSDARLKHHVDYVGRSPSGIPIFEFTYNDSPNERWRGTLAQELLSIRPDAVSTGMDGYYRVDYGKLDVKLEEVASHASVVE